METSIGKEARKLFHDFVAGRVDEEEFNRLIGQLNVRVFLKKAEKERRKKEDGREG